MNNKFFVYALFVTITTTLACWTSLLASASGSSGSSGGSSWSSRSGSSYGGHSGSGYGGGGHK